tara:strand:- start:19830 stop:20867 length:1038 start_codon:yes stop_codon:yes gene_type:complete
MKKKRIFLGGYINHLSAQNINCKSIATHLNKNKYEVRTLVLGDSGFPKIEGVKLYKVSNVLFSISNTISFVRAVIWSDICYLPKHQYTPKIALKIASYIGVKVFTTIEGNLCDTTRKNMIDNFGGLNVMRQYFSLIPNIFGITKHIIENANCGIQLGEEPLFLGVEKQDFYFVKKARPLKNLIFIGSLIERKEAREIIELAKYFPELTFNIVGDGPLKERLKSDCGNNVTFYNRLDHKQLSILLQDMDLHFLPSKSEGFPKVILEAASASIPSVLYDSYGASDWVINNENGFIVSSFDQIHSLINDLLDNPKLLLECSEKVLILAEQFDWKNQIVNWEKRIENLK